MLMRMTLSRWLTLCIALVLPLQATAAQAVACSHHAVPVEAAAPETPPCHESPANAGGSHGAGAGLVHGDGDNRALVEGPGSEAPVCDCDSVCTGTAGVGIVAGTAFPQWPAPLARASRDRSAEARFGYHQLPLRPPSPQSA